MRVSAALFAAAVACAALAPSFAFAGAASSDEVAVRTYFADLPVMVAIARCESDFMQYDDSGATLTGGYRGHMIGIFQFAPFHKAEALSLSYDITTLAGNLGYARYLYDEEGTAPWQASYDCWSGATIAAQASDPARSAKLALLKEQLAFLSAQLNALIAARSDS